MHIENFREYCLQKTAVTESFPFDQTTLVLKVADKMFALANLEGDLRINLKCDPELAIELREKHPCVIPGYHMSKKHWNSIIVDGSVPDSQIYEWIDHSYDLIVNSLTRKKRKEAGLE